MANTGYQAKMALGIESSWGTKASSFDDLLFLINESIGDDIKFIENDHLIGLADLLPPDIGRKRGVGTFSVRANYQNTDRLWAAALGGSIATTGTGPYTHVIEAGTEISKSLSLAILKKSIWVVTGVKIKKITLSGSAASPVVLACDIVGKDISISGSETFPALGTAPNIKFSDLVFRIGDTGTALGAGDELGIASFEFSLENPMEDDLQTNASGDYIDEPKMSGRRKVTLSFEIPNPADETLLSKLKSGTLMQSDLTFSNGNYSLKIEIPGLKIRSVKENIDDEGVIGISIEAEGFYNTNPDMSYNNVTVTIVNDRATLWT